MRSTAVRGVRPGRRYLVDPASSHMLVSKIKPCMSKYIPSNGETANGSLNQLWFLRSCPTRITVVILELIRATSSDLTVRALLLDQNQSVLGGFGRRPELCGEFWITSPIATAMCRRHFFQTSALSTFDGT